MDQLSRFLVVTAAIASVVFMLPQGGLGNELIETLESKPNIVLVMADDQGWGQTSFNDHPILKTPNLDAMSMAGLRFDRFYAAAPNCSPTRASVLTGRTNLRTGVESHGFALRLQEKTLAQALQKAGYATAHFGKWHLNGMRGPGVPIFANDTHHPGVFGFDKWLSVTNFFDRNPLMSRQGEFESFTGDSSEIIVDEAIKFIAAQAEANQPSFTVIWFGTPHSPFMAAEEDAKPFSHLDKNSQDQHGELVAMDRSIGTLRKALRDKGIADNTIVWFTSDNGGLPKIKPNTTGGLRGFKGSVYEGGLRVPAIVEWPSSIKPRVTKFPSVSMDIFPTIAEVVDLPADSMLKTVDGISLRKLFDNELGEREKPIPFNCLGNQAIIDNDWKLILLGKRKNQAKKYELYNLADDPNEKQNLFGDDSNGHQARLLKLLTESKDSINQSFAGRDYVEKKLLPENPEPRFWSEIKDYKPYFEEWKQRPEYKSWLEKRSK
jgi:arylsulfatase A-like enzyme